MKITLTQFRPNTAEAPPPPPPKPSGLTVLPKPLPNCTKRAAVC